MAGCLESVCVRRIDDDPAHEWREKRKTAKEKGPRNDKAPRKPFKSSIAKITLPKFTVKRERRFDEQLSFA